MKLNFFDMISKFTAATEYKVTQKLKSKLDFILNWGEQKIAIYLDDSYVSTTKFFYQDITIASTNAIVLYNLSPGTVTKLRNLKLCATRCVGGETLVYNESWLMAASIIVVAMITFINA
jgi:uncharacterized phage-like protein YoqJ